MCNKENSFTHVTDPESLSDEERRRYRDYWALWTTGELLGDITRLNRLKWGVEGFGCGMNKTRFEVINLSKYD